MLPCHIRLREGWSQISAVRNHHLHEVKSTYILQPGPAALTEGIRQVHAVLAHVAGVEIDPNLAPKERLDSNLVARSS
jgi:iron complex transport system substrate-binding protein